MSSSAEEILKLYQTKNASFAARYSLDLFVALCIVILFTVGTGYFSIMGMKGKYTGKNWAKHRCDPSIMPFAGMLNAPKGTDPAQYTAENFGVCLSTILTAAEDAVQAGFDAVASGIIDAIVMAGIAAGDLAGFVSKLRALIGDLLALFGGSGASGGDSMQGASNSLAQVHYALSGIVGTFMQSNQSGMGMTGSMGNMAFSGGEELVWKLMGIATALMPLAGIPFIGFIFVAIIIALDVLGLVVEAIIATIKAIFDLGLSMDEELNAATIKMYCFGKETPVLLNCGTTIPISQCRPGMMTKEDGVITAVQELGGAGRPSLLCELNGVRVTGEHQLLMSGKWINASDHPDAAIIGKSTEMLWCVSTSKGTLTVGGHRFADWEELDNEDLECLGTTQANKATLHRPLPNDCLVRLYDGRHITVGRVKCGDRLANGAMVCGKVRLLGGGDHLITTNGRISITSGQVLDYTMEIDSRLPE